MGVTGHPEGVRKGPGGRGQGMGGAVPIGPLGGGFRPQLCERGHRGVALMGRNLGRWELGLLCGGPPTLSLPQG